MFQKRNAPGREAEGVECQLAGDTDAYITEAHRLLVLHSRYGLSRPLASTVSVLLWEARHG